MTRTNDRGVAGRRASGRWGSLAVRSAYDLDGWSDPGEEAAFAPVLPVLSSSRVLDIGIGVGRTTTILEPSASSYVGVDNDARMVRAARERHPGADLRIADARALDGYADGSFDLLVFSLNGVDCLWPDERVAFLQSAFRLLQPGGVLIFSTHNLDGPSYAQAPSTTDLRERIAAPGLSARPKAVLAGLAHLGLAQWHHRRNIGLAKTGPDWAMAPLQSHDFRFVVHFIRFQAAREQVAACGFDLEGAWSERGVTVDLAAARHGDHYVHLLCRRPQPS